jgi:hypothetical protein
VSTFKVMGAGSLLEGMAFQRAIVFSDIISKQMLSKRFKTLKSCDGLVKIISDYNLRLYYTTDLRNAFSYSL